MLVKLPQQVLTKDKALKLFINMSHNHANQFMPTGLCTDTTIDLVYNLL